MTPEERGKLLCQRIGNDAYEDFVVLLRHAREETRNEARNEALEEAKKEALLEANRVRTIYSHSRGYAWPCENIAAAIDALKAKP